MSMTVSTDSKHSRVTPVIRRLGHSHICDCPTCDQLNQTIHQSQTTTTESCVPPRYVAVVVTSTSRCTKWPRLWSNVWQWRRRREGLPTSYGMGQSRSDQSCSFLWFSQDGSHIYSFVHWEQTAQLLSHSGLYFLRNINSTSLKHVIYFSIHTLFS